MYKLNESARGFLNGLSSTPLPSLVRTGYPTPQAKTLVKT